jgi:MYND finger
MPPSSSKKDAKSSSKKQQRAIQKQIDEENEKKLVDEFMATALGQVAAITEAPIGHAPSKHPDNPPCDGCQEPFAGTMQCAQCQAVFYCCRDCQVSHWSSQHKAECAMRKKQNDETARLVMGSFVDWQLWFCLDVTGAYNAAVRYGLHNKIRHAMGLDKADFSAKRYRDAGSCVFYIKYVMLILFRGQRAEGTSDVSIPEFNCMDGVRIKDYVNSHPDALMTWLQASVQLLHALTDQTLLETHDARQEVWVTAVRVWDSWAMVFTSKVASRAIFTPVPSSDAHAANGSNDSGTGEGAEQQRKRLTEMHALRIVTLLREAYHLILSDAGLASDPGADVKTCISEASALVQLRLHEYGIMGINVEAILQLDNDEKKLYQHMALPMAKRGIEKGRKLTPQEMNAVIAAAYGRDAWDGPLDWLND